MEFEVIGTISDIEIIAVGKPIRELGWLRRVYGSGRWRKLKGLPWFAWLMVLWATRSYIWYEAHGIGKKEMKIKRLLKD